MLINPDLPSVHSAGLWQPVGHPRGAEQNLEETVVQFTCKGLKLCKRGFILLFMEL